MPQIIVYIQDKKRLAKLIEVIRKQVSSFEKNADYLEIHANISEANKENVKDYVDRVRVVFMTASASRGLSFPKTTHILVDIPRFEVEQNLMEIIQVMYRSRGEREMDMKEKEVLFYLSDRAVYYEGDRELSLRESVLNLLNVLLILKTSIMTRIAGSGQVGLQRLMMIPVGGKSVLAAGGTYIGKMGRLIGELRKQYELKPDHRDLKDASVGLRELFGQADLRVTNTSPPTTVKAMYQHPAATYLALRTSFSSKFEDAVFNGLHKLLEWEPMELGYISGGLLIVPIINKKVQERYLLKVEEKLREAKDSTLWQALKRICVNGEYPESLQSAAKDALDLLELLNKTSPEKIQQLMQDSQHADQYYAFPLLTFMHSEMMKRYFNCEKGEQEEPAFKSLLTAYIHTLYPVTDILPIGESYRDFPFILFRSFNLKEVRHKIFADTYLCISNEMNVLNMLLAYRQETSEESSFKSR